MTSALVPRTSSDPVAPAATSDDIPGEVTDAHLVALAATRGVTVDTFDRAMATTWDTIPVRPGHRVTDNRSSWDTWT